MYNFTLSIQGGCSDISFVVNVSHQAMVYALSSPHTPTSGILTHNLRVVRSLGEHARASRLNRVNLSLRKRCPVEARWQLAAIEKLALGWLDRTERAARVGADEPAVCRLLLVGERAVLLRLLSVRCEGLGQLVCRGGWVRVGTVIDLCWARLCQWYALFQYGFCKDHTGWWSVPPAHELDHGLPVLEEDSGKPHCGPRRRRMCAHAVTIGVGRGRCAQSSGRSPGMRSPPSRCWLIRRWRWRWKWRWRWRRTDEPMTGL